MDPDDEQPKPLKTCSLYTVTSVKQSTKPPSSRVHLGPRQ